MSASVERGLRVSPLSSPDSSVSSFDSQVHGYRRRRRLQVSGTTSGERVLRPRHRKALHALTNDEQSPTKETVLTPLYLKCALSTSDERQKPSRKKTPSNLKRSTYSFDDNHLKKSYSKRLMEEFDEIRLGTGELLSPSGNVAPKTHKSVVEDIEDGIRTIIKHAYTDQDKNISSLVDGLEAERRHELRDIKRRHEAELKSLLKLLERELATVGKSHAQTQAILENRLERSQMAAIKASDELEKLKKEAYKDVSELEDELESVRRSAAHEVKTLEEELNASHERTTSLENEVKLLQQKLEEKDSAVSKEIKAIRADASKQFTVVKELHQNQIDNMKRQQLREIEKFRAALVESSSSKDEQISLLEKELKNALRSKAEMEQHLADQTEQSSQLERELKDALRNKAEKELHHTEEIRLLKGMISEKKHPVNDRMESVKVHHHWEEASGLTRQSDFDQPKHSSSKYRQRGKKHSRHQQSSSDHWTRKSYPKSLLPDDRDDLEGERLVMSFSSDDEERLSSNYAEESRIGVTPKNSRERKYRG